MINLTAEHTSLHLRRALRGDRLSLDWIVARFSPLLHAQARYRLGTRLRQFHDPSDIVNDVWLRALPRLQGLSSRGDRYTPVILRFLTTTLVHRISDLFDKHFRGKAQVLTFEAEGETNGVAAARLPAADSTAVISRAVRAESTQVLWRVLEELDPRDREVLVLRGIEQRDNQEVAGLLGIDGDAASARYRRALTRIRARLPESMLVELQTGAAV